MYGRYLEAKEIRLGPEAKGEPGLSKIVRG